ncbi:MAG: DUF362 domain-containing protein [Clostridia bacterium]|nr:DUF362 domain-containing protein [Clostridia bacterium]
MSIVSVIKVDKYDTALLERAVDEHFDRLGLACDIKPDMKVLIKPNLLSARKPECVATTHPEVILAIIKKLKSLGVESVTVADSPGGPYLAANLSSVYSACGYKALEKYATLNYSTGSGKVRNENGKVIKEFDIIDPIREADYIINVAKLKTHSLTGMSGGIKNMFGAIPGLVKPEMHYRFPGIGDFSEMLIDLFETVRPNVTFIDAVVGMEGEGPNMGTPKNCGYFLASRDVYAQDAVAAGIIGIPTEKVEMIKCAEERGLFEPADTVLVGDSIECKDFLLPETDDDSYLSGVPSFMRGTLGFFAKRFLKPVPNVKKGSCVGCGKCAESCPQHIIEIKSRKARIIKKSNCISCFCCQEMCPAHSITVKRRLKR